MLRIVFHPVLLDSKSTTTGDQEPRVSRAVSCGGSKAGFSLVELLVVLAIVGGLAGLVATAVQSARESAKSAACQSNLRQIAQAAVAYADAHRGEFPWGLKSVPGYSSWCWDFVTPAGGSPEPGEIWDGCGDRRVLSCPAYLGKSDNWNGADYTGYNYNCSFIGKVEGDPAKRQSPRRMQTVKDPARTALFGDGEYIGGANKFMRAPKSDRQNDFSGKSLREAGTQGFRHSGRTNVVFCDGHVESLRQAYQSGGAPGFVAGRCGFLSPDNSLYSGE